jgi:hypothetical protein
MLSFDREVAQQADHVSSALTEPGKYVGVITRAEKLLSEKGTQGLGLSFKTDNGMTADYLDLYTINKDGDALPSYKTAQAILGCLQMRECPDGQIKVEKYNKETKKREEMIVPGYPSMIGKRIGFLLQKELGTNPNNGNETSKLVVYGVFQADTELTVSEILAKKTKPETLAKMVEALMANPVRDNRKNVSKAAPSSHPNAPGNNGGFDDDLNW